MAEMGTAMATALLAMVHGEQPRMPLILPTEPSAYEAPTLADIKTGDLTSAEQMLRRGLTVIPAPASISLHVLLAQVLHAEKQGIALALVAADHARLRAEGDRLGLERDHLCRIRLDERAGGRIVVESDHRALTPHDAGPRSDLRDGEAALLARY